jgi:glycine/serine hydroxymethyltransferase
MVSNVGQVHNVAATVASIRQAREEAAAREQSAVKQAATLAKELAAEGVALRDIGQVLGVTFQRAHQLVHA